MLCHLEGHKGPPGSIFERGRGFTFRSNKNQQKIDIKLHVEDPDSSSHFGCPSFPQLFNIYVYVYVYIYIYDDFQHMISMVLVVKS